MENPKRKEEEKSHLVLYNPTHTSTVFLAKYFSLSFLVSSSFAAVHFPSLSFSMNRPKVNPVFDGRGRKRTEENSSRSARMSARGRRTNGVTATRALAINPDNRSMVTRSMLMEELGQGTLYEVEIIQAPLQETNDPTEQVQPQLEQEVLPVENKGDGEESLVLDDLPMICNYEEHKEQVPQEEEPVDEVLPVENKGDGEESLVLDDLPTICNYEEGWPCFNVGYDYGWHSYCEATNEFWEPFGDVNFEPVWDDPLWNDDETKKL
ncbi:hypothetical protein HRI_000012900 [Hibiscus trionum]|uniref:Uncharacterized protein n=1 Tax=Hibiscus trionum TaxID=183268 RepID=A0A9W7GRE7_HIBTR|nr:hypothetical protein HRI_000012900 [Hibiscus trionum]